MAILDASGASKDFSQLIAQGGLTNPSLQTQPITLNAPPLNAPQGNFGASQNNPLVTVTDPVLASALAKIAGTATKGQPTSSTTTGDNEAVTFQFVAGWILLIVLLTAAAQTRIGYVIIYYSLILMILLILVTEYQQIVPMLNFETIGQLNAKKSV